MYMSKNNNLTDFGEKIGGARKDLWVSRGLIVSDLEEMNDREANKYVVKDNVWKRPDYEALSKEGIPVEVLYWRNEIRKAINAKPNFFWYDGDKELCRKEYIETVRIAERLCSNIKSAEEAISFFEKFYVQNGYMKKCEYSYGYEYTLKGRHDPALSDKLYKVSRLSSPRYLTDRYKAKAEREQFAVSKDKKLPKGIEIHFNDGSGYSKNNDWKPNTYYVTRGCYIVKTNFTSEEEAIAWAKENLSVASTKKKKFTPPQLEHIERTGPNYRSGVEIDGNNYLETFGFRGGEFGNWLNQNDRQTSMNMGFEALKDLANALHISDFDIALGGSLAIAFGARGHGKAVAHYEPLRKVINLTKMRGAGSLAHEWWHALDDYLGSVVATSSSFLSDISYKYEPMEKLMNAISLRKETEEEAKVRVKKRAESYKRSDEKTLKNAESWVNFYIRKIKDKCPQSNYGVDACAETCAAIKAKFIEGEESSVEDLNLLHKDITKHVIAKKDRENLQFFVRTIKRIKEKSDNEETVNISKPTIRYTRTDYLKNSKKMDESYQKDGDYWACNKELTARAFACYIKDNLTYKSDYLVGHAESAISLDSDSEGNPIIIKAFPEGEERKAINEAFDNLFLNLKKDGYLNHNNKVKPIEKSYTDFSNAVQLSIFELLSTPI